MRPAPRYRPAPFPPRSYDDGLRDRARARHEVERIAHQLADASRPLCYASVAAYERWAESARHASKMIAIHVDRLDAWLAENAPGLLERVVRAYVRTVSSLDDPDAEELAMRDECRAWISERDQKKARAG